MADKINANNLGMTLGIFVAIFHVLWAVLVALGFAQTLIDWVLPLHFVDMLVSVIAFTWVNALLITVMSFVGGYIMGWLFATLWNCKCLGKK